MSNTLTKEALEEIKDVLLVKKDELEKRLKSLKEEDPYSDEDKVLESVDPGDESAEQFDHQRVEAMEQEIRESLKEIEEALSDIDDGEYGVCEDCGDEIDPKRLTIKPMAQYCVQCEAKEENN